MSAQEQLEIARFVRALKGQIHQHLAKKPDFAYANVTSVSPLLVLMDGSVTPSPAVKDALYSPTIGDRVYVHIVRHQLVVGGAIG